MTMPDAVFDMIAAGLPYRSLRGAVTDADLARFGILKGGTTAISAATAANLRGEFSFASSAHMGSAGRLAIELACLGRKIGILDRDPARGTNGSPYLKFADTASGLFPEEHLGSASACRFDLATPDGRLSHAFYHGGVDDGDIRLAALAARAARILCVEDRLWDVDKGGAFAGHAIEAARAAGRITVLVCRDAECVDRNHAVMRAVADRSVTVIAGEAQAVLALHHLQRLDSLGPQLRAHGQRAVVWRENHSPLLFEGETPVHGDDDTAISAAYFWRSFLPGRLVALAESGMLNPFAALAPPARFQPDGRAEYHGRI